MYLLCTRAHITTTFVFKNIPLRSVILMLVRGVGCCDELSRVLVGAHDNDDVHDPEIRRSDHDGWVSS